MDSLDELFFDMDTPGYQNPNISVGEERLIDFEMVVDNMNSSRLLSPVIDALYGSSIQQKNSFLFTH